MAQRGYAKVRRFPGAARLHEESPYPGQVVVQMEVPGLGRRSLRWIQIYALIYVNVHNDVIHCGISESHESYLDVSGSIWHAKKSSKDFLCIQVAFLDSAMLWLILRAGNAINQSELRSLAEML